ncbi:bis(5'-nucleosyl)-tetraphosphatase (symmetrical) YqeK [Pseudothermotoga thermarum]|uniref:bis(5'-nucleosyl)-tetraphosphatase (symmetrical) n=1 Tax=Pseudothermotoga thermarum DSM 5069 TaxID=688269 RepID=F7YXM3_9THEM|nr:bis(5'-nucleosyl)-tetraphosphatase (symmetrical) YqeK [Pseudothermotoga thermarum]AEH50665.1 metal dependent phosphohydrolase [Pseudothermotoga thermarum DSM 5069]
MTEKVGEKAFDLISELRNLAFHFLTPSRYNHAMKCVEFGLKLAEIHKIDKQKVEISCLAHDLFRDFPPNILLKLASRYGIVINDYELVNPVLLHGKVAAKYLERRYQLRDEKLLLAVAYHTSGHKDFDEVGKILFLADSLEESRDYESVQELRKLAMEDLKEGLLKTLANKICYAIQRSYLLLPETIEMWNELIKRERFGFFEPDMLQNNKKR